MTVLSTLPTGRPAVRGCRWDPAAAPLPPLAPATPRASTPVHFATLGTRLPRSSSHRGLLCRRRPRRVRRSREDPGTGGGPARLAAPAAPPSARGGGSGVGGAPTSENGTCGWVRLAHAGAAGGSGEGSEAGRPDRPRVAAAAAEAAAVARVGSGSPAAFVACPGSACVGPPPPRHRFFEAGVCVWRCGRIPRIPPLFFSSFFFFFAPPPPRFVGRVRVRR